MLDLQGKSSHSAWLTFMYPRLQLAKELLSDDGVIFISIDDNEQANLKMLCDEVFGEQNFIDNIIWKGKGGGQDSINFVKTYESIITYACDITYFNLGSKLIDDQEDNYRYFDANRGLRYNRQLARKWGSNSRRSDRPNLYFGVLAPDGQEIFPRLPDGSEGCWRHGKDRLVKEINSGEFEFVKDDLGEWVLYQKIFAPSNGKKEVKFTNIIEYISSGSGAKSLKSIFDGQILFDYSKPDILIRYLLSMIDDRSCYVLDFFSGSSTTAHAVMQLNAQDGGSRRCISVQLPEQIATDKPAYKAGYRTIDEIGRERIRRAAAKIKEETGADIDYGFRLFRIEEPSGQTLDNLLKFPEGANGQGQLLTEDYVSKFDLNKTPGHDTILTTWLNQDGYGLTTHPTQLQLDTYTLDICGDSAYIINTGLTSADVVELVRKLENKKLDISRLVVFGYSVDFSVMHELKKNLSILKSGKTVSLLERF